MFPRDICLVCVYEGGDLFVDLRYIGILWRVFACQVSVAKLFFLSRLKANVVVIDFFDIYTVLF